MRGEHCAAIASGSPIPGSSPHARGAPMPHRRRSSQNGAHPRMRGEHGHLAGEYSDAAGSSPHARGARRCPCCGGWAAGLIPACAGSTATWTASGTRPGAHPRMRGEHTVLMTTTMTDLGSSPHARGARAPRRTRRHRCGSSPHARGARGLPVEQQPARRLIPACAGSTSGSSTIRQRARGSSPHARGAPVDWAAVEPVDRLIPACAGSTRSRRPW